MTTTSTSAGGLTAVGLTKRFGPVTALREVDLEIPSGAVTALMGENGAGKSTLLRILNGDHRPDSGTIELDGRGVSFDSPDQARAAGLRVIAQEPEIIPHVSVAENIYVGALGRAGGRSGLAFNRRLLLHRAQDLIERFGFERVIRPDTLGRHLPPAQRQVVEILRALVDDPQVICFDEPTSSLGDEEVDRLFALIGQLREQGRAIAYVSHRMKEIFQLADRVTVLRDGRLVGTRPVAETDDAELVRMMVGRDLSQLYDRTPSTPGGVVLQVDRLSSADVHDISFEVRAGEVVGIAGLVGAGRSELLKAIVADLPVTAGTVHVDGRARRFRSPSDAIAAGIGFAPEERKAEALIMQRTVRDNTVLAILRRLARGLFISARAERAVASTYIGRLRIRTPSAEQLVKNLSGGNQQKVVLARWLAAGPRVLLLDEPTRGVDVGAKAEIYQIIDDLAADGVAVVVVSSELPEVIGISDRILVMAAGRITGELTRDEADEEKLIALAMTDHTLPIDEAPTERTERVEHDSRTDDRD